MSEETSEIPAQPDFARDVEPVFAERCYDCHGPDNQEGKLRMDARSLFFRGGVSGASIDELDSAKSLLLKRLRGEGDHPRMPLDAEPLSEREIQLIQRWIEQGADWPDGIGSDIETLETHWAYRTPVRPQIPVVESDDWGRTAIDSFVLRKLRQNNLRPSPEAEDATLLRRLYLDLLGLPPTVEEVDEYLRDIRPDKYRRVVARLLASHRYGERWARPWLDAARYADSNGYQADQYRSVWPYRDWVVRALNSDMPFDRFTLEQLAGDLLPGASVDQHTATGFHRLTTCNVEAGVDPEENRVNQIIDRVNTTATVWLGTTIECAQCHNHKYDPFSQKDYYQLFAYFNSTPLEVEGNGVTYNFVGPKMDLPLSSDDSNQLSKLQDKLSELQAAQRDREASVTLNLPVWEAELKVTPDEIPKWHLLSMSSFESLGGADHERKDDGSILVKGKTPGKDTYTVVADTTLQGISGFKLEALTDESLPGNGPGRYQRPNFVLNEFSVTVASLRSEDQESSKIELYGAAADFSQKSFPVQGAIDGDSSTAWAINPQFGKPHWATFLVEKPIEDAIGSRLTFRLEQNFGGGRTIGRLRLSAMTGKPAREHPVEILELLAIPSAERTGQQQKQIQEYHLGLDRRFQKLKKQVADIQKRIAAIKPDTTLVMIEMREPRVTNVFRRGDFLSKGEVIQARTPASLLPASEPSSSDRRLLANWITSRDNPLTARVAVNRSWAQFFGQGIVATLEDFGTQGDLPTHPDLLDWLAVEFMDSGWSLKHLHRLIVTSTTYRQSSFANEGRVEIDPSNLLYARGPRFRLSAETIRDNALAVSGLLTEKLSGPPVFPPQPSNVWRHVGRNAPQYNTEQGEDRFRRGIYVFWRRSAPYPSFTNFDAPDRASCVVKRARTNTPLQALTLLNDPAYVEMAFAFARRLLDDRPQAGIDERVEYAWQLSTGRRPDSDETAHLVGVYLEELSLYQQPGSEVKQLVGEEARGHDPAQIAAWFHVTNILLNLDETICKE